jgi:hypothetical protein
VADTPNMTDAGMSPQWRALAVKLRDGLTGLGIKTVKCMPGEADFCGADYAHHCLSYAAAIHAYGAEAVKHLHHDEPATMLACQELTEHWTRMFASQGEHCDRCEKPPVPA